MQDNIRPIAPISVAGLTPKSPETGMPICEVVDPTTLHVDPAYQRNVGEKGDAPNPENNRGVRLGEV